MSLQVWLPLNGNLNNYGLSELSIHNNGATVDSNGKIGSCYLVNAGKKISFSSYPWMTMKPQYDFSCFFWVKGTTNGWLFACSAWEFMLRPSFIQVHLAGNGQYPARYTATFDTNTWYHLGFTWSGTEGKLRLYLNGSLVATSDVPSSASYDIASSFNIPYDGPRYINDFRLYDHCLSAKEVKEISKGLVCHYKLDNNGLGNPNLITTMTPGGRTALNGKYGLNADFSQNLDTYGYINVSPALELNSAYTLSFDVSNFPRGGAWSFNLWNNANYSIGTITKDGHYTYTFVPSESKLPNGYSLTKFLFDDVIRTNPAGTVHFTNFKIEKGSVATPWCPHESDELYYQLGICGKNLLPNSTLDRDGWENPSGSAILQDNGYYKVTFSGSTGWWGSRYAVTLEAGKTYVASCKGYGTKTQMWFWKDGPNSIGGNINTTSTPQFLYVKYTPTVSGSYYIVCYAGPNNVNYYKDVHFYECSEELDCSGLSNNGTKIGGLSPSTNPASIRYESCYDFDGNTGSIQIPSLSALAPSGEFTMNCWIYHDNTWSSEGYETIFGGPSGFELDAKHSGTNSPRLYACDWGKGSTTYELNKWNMITMTRNTSETKFYVNGELKITGSAGTIPSGNYFIGAWRTSSEQNFKGKISDFRLYSTVLSADDIRMLYDTSASVDKSGNMYAYEFKEE